VCLNVDALVFAFVYECKYACMNVSKNVQMFSNTDTADIFRYFKLTSDDIQSMKFFSYLFMTGAIVCLHVCFPMVPRSPFAEPQLFIFMCSPRACRCRCVCWGAAHVWAYAYASR
jgi:hypothetical protein